VLIARIFRKQQPRQHGKSDNDADDGQPGSDLIHEHLLSNARTQLGKDVQAARWDWAGEIG